MILWRTLGVRIGLDWSAASEAIIWDLRLPRVLTAMVIGSGLAVAGATFQGLLRNPLADPYVLGTASGAALGAAIAVLIPVQIVLVEFGLLHGLRLRRGPAVRVRRLPARWLRWRRRADPPPPHRLRRRVRAGGAPDDGHVRLGRRPAPDLLVPARWARGCVVGPPRGRGAADHRGLRPHDRCEPGRSTACSSAMPRRATSASTSGANGASCWPSPRWRRRPASRSAG